MLVPPMGALGAMGLKDIGPVLHTFERKMPEGNGAAILAQTVGAFVLLGVFALLALFFPPESSLHRLWMFAFGAALFICAPGSDIWIRFHYRKNYIRFHQNGITARWFTGFRSPRSKCLTDGIFVIESMYEDDSGLPPSRALNLGYRLIVVSDIDIEGGLTALLGEMEGMYRRWEGTLDAPDHDPTTRIGSPPTYRLFFFMFLLLALFPGWAFLFEWILWGAVAIPFVVVFLFLSLLGPVEEPEGHGHGHDHGGGGGLLQIGNRMHSERGHHPHEDHEE